MALAAGDLQLEHQKLLERQAHTCLLVLLLVLGEVRGSERSGAVGQAALGPQQRRQTAYAPVLEHGRRARAHDQKPRGVARRSGTQRDPLGRQLEIE